MLYKISEINGQSPSFVISQTDAFIAFVVALLLFGLLSVLIVYHLSTYSIKNGTALKIQLLYMLGAGVIILATAGTLFAL
jgi:hypothetical protein